MSVFFIEGFLGDELSSQVLNLLCVLSLHCVSLLTHQSTPDTVQFVEDLRHTGLCHLSTKVMLYPLDCPDSISRNPFILQVNRGPSCTHSVI